MRTNVLSILLVGMGDPVLASDGIPKIPTDMFGPYPILQFFAALIVFVCFAIGGLVYLKGKAAGDLSAPKSNEAAVQLFFEGPLKAIFDYLQAIRATQEANSATLSNTSAGIRDMFAGLLSGHRQQLTKEIYDAKAEVKEEIQRMHDENKSALKDINDLLVRMDERDKQRRQR